MANLVGKEFGKYRITDRIGRGGMAEVYLGVHTLLDRPVAIKVLHGYLVEDEDFIERFRREAKAVANLRHPNIVQVYDFDIQDDLIFMVMEYIDGANLQQLLTEHAKKGERFPIKQMGSIINDVANALDYAHAQGMLHRDIKPSNVMVDKQGKAYLTDFGLARIVSDQKLTATGTLLGTPAYMSPEQGKGEELTEESDIYSLGIVAFEMLTGKLPYDAPTPIGIVQKQITEPVPDIGGLIEGIPATAQEVIDRALAKSPEVRYSSADELVNALRVALQALESTETTPPKNVPSTKAEDEVFNAPTVKMELPEIEKATVVMQEETETKAEPQKETTKFISSPQKKASFKLPFWGWIVIGVAVFGIGGVILTQVINPNEQTSVVEFSPTPETEETQTATPKPTAVPEIEEAQAAVLRPTAIPGKYEFTNQVVFDASHMEEGLYIRLNGDADAELITAGPDNEQAWRTGNGQALPSPDGNSVDDLYMKFDIDNDFLYQLPEGVEIQIEVEYLDQGYDYFLIEYDAIDGGPRGDGTFMPSEEIKKTNSGEFKTAVFVLSDAYFSNRTHQDGDFRIDDRMDGAETIRRVTVMLVSSNNGDDYFSKAENLRTLGSSEDAAKFYSLALQTGYEENAHLYNMRGLSYLELREFDLCVEDYTKFFALEPTNPWAPLERGDCYFGLGEIDLAKQDYAAFLELSEGDSDFNEKREQIQTWLEEN